MNQLPTQKKTPKKSKKDPLVRIKHIAYCLTQLPPDKSNFGDFVRWCQLQLAIKTNRLMKDPIWEQYTPEEILVEYFAHKFEIDPKFKTEFEMQIELNNEFIDEFAEWADKQMGTEKKLMDGLEDKISFDPSKDVMGEDN